MYKAEAVIMPVTTKDSGGSGIGAALMQQLSGMPGFGIPGSASSAEVVGLLKSNVLREKMVQKYNLLPILFYEDWDEQKKDWKRDSGISLNPLYYVSLLAKALAPPPPGARKKEPGVPDMWDALRLLDDLVDVNFNMKESTITISVSFHDPDMAAKLVDYFLITLNDYMSSEAKRVANTNRKYLEDQLGASSDPFIKQKTYNLIAQQIETAMMAEVKENFAFKVIDPPLAPDKKFKPKRAVMVVLSIVVALFLGIFGAFFWEYIEKVRAQQGQGAEEEGGKA